MLPLLAGLAASVLTVLVMLLVRNMSAPEKQVRFRVESLYAAGDEQFSRAMSSLLGPPLLRGNKVTPLHNGDRIFPSMIEAIRSARHTIVLETFIYWSGRIGTQFAEAISERARAGVKVHVLLDWFGSAKISTELVDMMTAAGAEVERYHPVRWYNLDRFNNRTHRKILVVDGRIGFTGGVGIADKWEGNAEDPDHWRDSHYRLEGPAVAQMQAAFVDNWTKSRARVLHGDGYFPALESAGNTTAQVFRSSPRGGSESVRLMYLLAIASARQSLLIGNSYFVPDNMLVKALVDARSRGVRVEIIVPGIITDSHIVRRASSSRWTPLLEAGIRLHEFQPTMYHVKVLIVDGIWTSVGSTNFDNRSFRLNDEANMNVLDTAFAAAETAIFEADILRSRLVTLEAWRRRPVWSRVKEWLAGLVRGQL